MAYFQVFATGENTYSIRSQIATLEDLFPSPEDLKYIKLKNALTNCINISVNFTVTTVEAIRTMVERVTKEPEGASGPSDSDDDD